MRISIFRRGAPALVAAALFLAGGTVAAQDTAQSGVENPPGYRGMERDTTLFPPGAEDSTAAAEQVRTAEEFADSTAQDSAAQDSGEVRNPPGYRGMERDTTLVSPQRGETGDTSAEADTSARRPGGDTLNPSAPESRSSGQHDPESAGATSDTSGSGSSASPDR